MKQWQMVQHKVEDEFKYSFSLVDIENGTLKFLVSVDIKPNEDGKLFAINQDKNTCIFPKEGLLDFLIEISNNNAAIIAYGEKVHD